VSALSYIRNAVLPAVYEVLPATMDSPESRAMLLAIGLQESKFQHRVQVRGPARGFWQFEEGGGVHGVLQHPSSRRYITPVLKTLLYEEEDCYEAIKDNDILAAVFARLLLWTDPKPLPKSDHPGIAWDYYLRNWRPGKPHKKTWAGYYKQAWGVV
jgi:hypothetical protein